MHRVLILVVLYMRLVHSWDIAISVGDRLEFYDNGIKTDTVQLTSHNPAAITYDEVHDTILFVDKRSDWDAVCGYNIASKDIRCFIKRSGGNIQHLAFDPVTNLLFFTDINEKTINWISLKDQISENNVYGNVLITMNEQTVDDLALDSCSGYIYWTKSPNKFMERARFNGAEKQLVNNYLPVFSFAIDSKTHKNYYISGFIHEFHNEVDVRNGNLYDDNSELIFSFLFQSEPRELTITEDYVYWMNSTVNYTTVWQRPKIAPRFVVPREICKFYSERPIGIAANYKIKDQVQDMESCKATSRLVPTAETAINSPNIEQKPQILEINQTTETELITE